MESSVLIEKRDRIALLTLNRPEKLNALDYASVDRLLDILEEIEPDDDIRAVILTGAGDRAFCAGADIRAFAPSVSKGPRAAWRDFVRRGHRLTSRIETFPKPVIVAVNGLAHGAGSEITEAAPLAIASERAEFCKAEINLGFSPPWGGSQRLPRHVGRKRALYMILTADRIPAKTAEAWGLVNFVVPHEALLDRALALAIKIAAKAPLAVAAGLGSVTRGLNVPIDEALQIEASHFARLVATQDMREGIAAWLARREPQFTGS
jgi:enoyl-CoA hydratase